MLSTVMNCFRQSNCLPDLQLENPVMAMYWSQSKECGLAAALCRIRNEQGFCFQVELFSRLVGVHFLYSQDDKLPIYFPFFAGAAVVEIHVKKLFSSNAKPALLLFRLEQEASTDVSSGPLPLHGPSLSAVQNYVLSGRIGFFSAYACPPRSKVSYPSQLRRSTNPGLSHSPGHRR